MRTINRAAYVVRPREPYLKWAAGLEDDSPSIVEVLRKQAAVYLVPEEPTGQEAAPPIAEFYQAIFEAELRAWDEDESSWPEPRNAKTFREWFEVAAQSIVVDLGTGPIFGDSES
jgi:hypothetical protein